jgi:transposase-like protein
MGTRRQFTLEQKMQILREAESEGMLNTCRKFDLSQALFYRWKHQFEHKGKDGLLPQYRTIDPELRAIQQENERLKRIVADQALELAVKTELLKKTEQMRMQGR